MLQLAFDVAVPPPQITVHVADKVQGLATMRSYFDVGGD